MLSYVSCIGENGRVRTPADRNVWNCFLETLLWVKVHGGHNLKAALNNAGEAWLCIVMMRKILRLPIDDTAITADYTSCVSKIYRRKVMELDEEAAAFEERYGPILEVNVLLPSRHRVI